MPDANCMSQGLGSWLVAAQMSLGATTVWGAATALLQTRLSGWAWGQQTLYYGFPVDSLIR